MSLWVVGAGLGRTGTHSLKNALEQLLDGPCYHMVEVINHPEHVLTWQGAIDGNAPDWHELMTGYRSAVDWPVAAFWRELSEAFPSALVLLSVRDTDAWWESASKTIFEVSQRDIPDDPVFGPQMRMAVEMLDKRFTAGWRDEQTAKAAYEQHNETVRRTVDPEHLLEWRPDDGWEPICGALGLAVPDVPFPHVNTADDFRALTGLDVAE